MEILILVSFILLALGPIGSVIPALPGPILSILGVYCFWWGNNLKEPEIVFLISLTVLGVIALLIDWFGPALASRLGGASTRTALVSGLIGLVGLILFGPLGMILSVFCTAVLVEFYRQRNFYRGLRAGIATLLGAVGAPLLQVLITGGMLLSMFLLYLT
jgi:uncharacterized protein YqgC (DUF456 family)